jgi:phenylacetate-coenzyme A ligase PaaK-like adenylate-forming protein
LALKVQGEVMPITAPANDGAGFWDRELDILPWPEVLRWQASRLAAIVADVTARSSFYARKLHRVSPVLDFHGLEDLPATTKRELRSAQEDADATVPYGLAQAVPANRISQTLSSSGTSGRPTLYPLTDGDVKQWAHGVANMFYTAGVRAGDTVVLLTGMPMVAGGLPFAAGIRLAGANLVWAGGVSTERLLDIMSFVRPTVVVATISLASHLIERYQEILGRPASALGVRRLLCGGEPGMADPEIRSRIKMGWGVTYAHEVMGLCDVMAGMWAECEYGNGMHFTAARHMAVELVDPGSLQQVSWEKGVTGELVYTTLDREAMPLIRFRSADRAVVTGASCPCGRSAPLIRCVGRTDDMLIYKAMNVFPSAIREVALSAAGERITSRMRIRKSHPSQVRFETPIPLELELAAAGEAEPAKALVEEAVRNRLGVRIEAELRPPGSIPHGSYKNALVYVAERAGG